MARGHLLRQHSVEIVIRALTLQFQELPRLQIVSVATWACTPCFLRQHRHLNVYSGLRATLGHGLIVELPYVRIATLEPGHWRLEQHWPLSAIFAMPVYGLLLLLQPLLLLAETAMQGLGLLPQLQPQLLYVTSAMEVRGQARDLLLHLQLAFSATWERGQV